MISGLVDSIWLSLSTALSVVIPYLYLIFEKLASVEILSQEEIIRIWNNLYVLLSVLILFAIAIKLINAIVNPDVLTDNKKGVRKAFFSAFIAIFLVVLLPIGFRLLHEIQNEIVNENIIQRYVFQNNDDNPSGELVWVAISSCIDLGSMEDVIDPASLGLEETSTGIWMPVEPEPWSASSFLGILAQARPWVALATRVTGTTALVENAFEFHPFILFIFLLVLTYELIVLVLDTALRAFKLLLLELMTPIILGAYVFKSDILKNWALEYIKTFLQVFLLIFAINLMEYIIPVATSIADNNSGFLFRGIIRMLLYIGVLRLIKQIFPLINKIFGTNIQGKGGIKGRLGEMAAVGGLAQKAWGALGTGVKNIGKLGLSLPAAGVGAGANALYKNKTGKNLTDHKMVRGARAGLSGVSTALKTGSWTKALDSANSTYDKTSASAVDKARYNQRINDNIDNLLTDGGDNESAIKDPNMVRKKSVNDRIKSNIRSRSNNNVANANSEYEKALLGGGIAKAVDKANQGITDGLTRAMGQYIEGDERRNRINKALGAYQDNGNLNELAKFIYENKDIIKDENIIKNLIGKNGSLSTKERLIQYAKDHQKDIGFSVKDLNDLQVGERAVAFLANNTLEGKIKSAKAKLDTELLGARLTELDKMYVEAQISTNESLLNSMPFAIGRDDNTSKLSSLPGNNIVSDTPYDYSSVGSGSTSQSTQSPSSSGGENLNINNVNNINNINNTQPATNNSSNESNNDNRRSNTDSNTATRVEVSNIDDINSTIKNAASDLTSSMNMVSDSINRNETRQRSRQEELLDAMGGHGMRSEEEIRNENENE